MRLHSPLKKLAGRSEEVDANGRVCNYTLPQKEETPEIEVEPGAISQETPEFEVEPGAIKNSKKLTWYRSSVHLHSPHKSFKHQRASVHPTLPPKEVIGRVCIQHSPQKKKQGRSEQTDVPAVKTSVYTPPKKVSKKSGQVVRLHSPHEEFEAKPVKLCSYTPLSRSTGRSEAIEVPATQSRTASTQASKN